MRRIDEEQPAEVGIMGMVIFIVSLSVLFTSAIVGFLLVGQPSEIWMPKDSPGLLLGLATSTAALIANGVALQRALQAVRAGRTARLGVTLLTASALGALFLVLQAANWVQVVVSTGPAAGPIPHGFFYMLTGLHALHVIGGMVPLLVVTHRARAGRYDRAHHRGILHCAMYWHFLDGVWLTTLAVMFLAS